MNMHILLWIYLEKGPLCCDILLQISSLVSMLKDIRSHSSSTAPEKRQPAFVSAVDTMCIANNTFDCDIFLWIIWVVVWKSDWRWRGRGFDSQPLRCCRVHAHAPLSLSSAIGTNPRWEVNKHTVQCTGAMDLWSRSFRCCLGDDQSIGDECRTVAPCSLWRSSHSSNLFQFSQKHI